MITAPMAMNQVSGRLIATARTAEEPR